VHAAVSEIELFKNWVFFPRSEKHLFTSLILLNIVKNTPATRKVIGNELEGYIFSFKLRSEEQLQVQCFSQKWHISENLENGIWQKLLKTIFQGIKHHVWGLYRSNKLF
jgi:hypothetical protein